MSHGSWKALVAKSSAEATAAVPTEVRVWASPVAHKSSRQTEMQNLFMSNVRPGKRDYVCSAQQGGNAIIRQAASAGARARDCQQKRVSGSTHRQTVHYSWSAHECVIPCFL